MLLRSASNPALESLIASSHTLDPLPATKNEGQEGVLSKCVSLSSSRGSSSSLLTCNYTHPRHNLHSNFNEAVWGSSCEGTSGCSPSTSRAMRKVLSENDLCSLGGPCFARSARSIAAHSLLVHDDNSTGHLPCSDIDVSSSLHHERKFARSSMSPFSWRRRSLSSLPSELHHSLSIDGDAGAILEGVEFASSNSSTTGAEEEDERETRVCVFDKIALPITETVYTKVDDVLSESATSRMNVEGVLGYGERGSVMNRETGTTTLVQQTYGQASHLKSQHHGDQWEMAPGTGDGGRGTRDPPTTTGGSGGGGEAGGPGGRSSDLTDLHYQNTLRSNPGHPLILRNYAQYLAEVKHDYRKAEEFFQRAILANPSDGELLGQYAKMLWEVQHDRERAATYFERAVQAAPDNSYVMASYASFLWSLEEEEEEEESFKEGSSRANVPASLVSLVSAGLA